MIDLLQYAVDYARSLGASYAEARYHSHKSFGITSRNGLLVSSGSSISRGVGVRVVVEGSLGFASTNKIDRESLKNTVEKAVNIARSSSKILKVKILFSRERLGRARYNVPQRKSFENISLEEKISLHKDLAKSVAEKIRESKLATLVFSYNEDVEEKIILNSDGAYVESQIPRVSGFINIVLAHPQRGTIQKSESIGAVGGYEKIEEEDLLNKMSSLTETMEKILLKGKEPPKDPVDIVLGSEVVGLVMHESIGHPFEADRILGREAAQAGESYARPDMLGSERIGNRYATVIDDPTIPGSYGFYLYDEEGVAARPKYLLREGVVNEFLHNRATATLFNVSSNGSSRAMDYRSEPIIRMSNTYLQPGDRNFEELIEDIRYGVYIKSYMEWNIDDTRWGQRYGGLEAYEIVDGELRDFIRNPVIEFTTKQFFSNIIAKSKDLRFYAGTCGKGEPSQGVPVWLGGPDVRLSKMRLGVIGL